MLAAFSYKVLPFDACQLRMLIRRSPSANAPVPSTGRIKRVAAKFHLSPGEPMFSIAELDGRQIGLAPMPEGRQT